MRLSNLLVGATLAGAILTACTTDEITIPKSELYAREFIKKFGVIDPDRDFNAATHSGVTVVTTRPTDVKIYADINGKRYIFAEGRKISGTTPITFDVPASVKEVLVDAGGVITKASLGSTVTLPKTGLKNNSTSRTINGDETEWSVNGRLSWKIAPEEKFGTSAVSEYIATYAEDDNTNLTKGTNSFYFLADGEEHTFYPFYWNTDAYHCLGIYTVNEDGSVNNQDLYYSKSGELEFSTDYKPGVYEEIIYKEGDERVFAETGEWQFSVGSNGELLNLGDLLGLNGDWNAPDAEKTFDEPLYTTEHGYISKIVWTVSDHMFRIYETVEEEFTEIKSEEEVEGTWQKVNHTSAYGASPTTYIKTRGITYKLEKGTRYGFYIKVNHEASKNPSTDYDYVCFSSTVRNKSYVADAKYMRYDQVSGTNVESDVNWRIRENPWSNAGWWNDTYAEDDAFAYSSWGTAHMGGKTYTMFGFEDCPQGYLQNAPCDLNDIMFLFAVGKEPSKVIDTSKPEPDPEVYQWLIAAEDLAGTYDWDFNDAVFAVSATTIVDGEDNKTTKTEITVEPLAAGGTLPIYVMFNGDISVENSEGTLENLGLGHYNIGPELHRWLGGYYRSPINVKEDVATAAGEPLKFTVAGEWSLTDKYQNKPQWSENDVKGMGGFYVLVNPGNTLNQMQMTISKFEEANLDDEKHFHKVTPPSSFDKQDQVVVSPEMLCLETHWCWPKEEQGIHEVYYYFQPWLTGEATEWYSDPANHWDAARVVTRK